LFLFCIMGGPRRATRPGHALRAPPVGPRAAGGASRRPRAPHRYALRATRARTQQRCGAPNPVGMPRVARSSTHRLRRWRRRRLARGRLPEAPAAPSRWGWLLHPVDVPYAPASQQVTGQPGCFWGNAHARSSCAQTALISRQGLRRPSSHVGARQEALRPQGATARAPCLQVRRTVKPPP
jgi:hypothetical protein